MLVAKKLLGAVDHFRVVVQRENRAREGQARCAEYRRNRDRAIGQPRHRGLQERLEPARLELDAEDPPAATQAARETAGSDAEDPRSSALDHQVNGWMRQRPLHMREAAREPPADDPIMFDPLGQIRRREQPRQRGIRARRDRPDETARRTGMAKSHASRSYNNAERYLGHAVGMRANAAFEIKTWEEQPWDEAAPKLTHVKVACVYRGDIEGEGSLQYLMTYREGGTIATFTGMERITASLG